MVNFPRVSRALSFFPLSTPIRFTLPEWLPVAMSRESGEKATDQVSTGKWNKMMLLYINIPVFTLGLSDICQEKQRCCKNT